jgi:hypothetical protein
MRSAAVSVWKCLSASGWPGFGGGSRPFDDRFTDSERVDFALLHIDRAGFFSIARPTA